MASNPMQRQARNSFLLGMVAAILVAAIIIVILFMQMKKLREENEEYKNKYVSVYVLTQDVKSGEVLTSDMFTMAEAAKSSLPADYVDVTTLLAAYSLVTKDGIPIKSKYANNEQQYYLDDGNQTPVYEEGERFYKTNGSAREYIETSEAAVISKIDAKANTIISQSMIARADDVISDDVRKAEYNTVILPIDLMTGDYVDIRLMFPSGQNFIVVSKKIVTIPDVNGEYIPNTIQMDLSEEEILAMSSAIVEDWMMQGSAMLYATKYVEAGLQEEAIPTYVPSAEVVKQMESDSNIVNRAKTELFNKYNQSIALRNENINSELSANGSKDGIPGKVTESTGATQEARQEYLEGLLGGTN